MKATSPSFAVRLSCATRPQARSRRWRWLVLAVSALVPALASAEGAVRVLDCSFLHSCDASGVCRKDSGQVSFRIRPLSLSAGGAGSYRIGYGSTKARMQAISRTTPYIWKVGDERDTLLASSDSDFLWFQLRLGPVPHATIRFMRCSFRE